MSKQELIKQQLAQYNIPSREIKVYGRQITIECISESSILQYGTIISKFARIRGIIKSLVETRESLAKNINTKHYMTVYRLYAVM